MPLRKFRMVRKLPIVRAVRKRIIRARRNRNHHNRLEEGLSEIRELHGQFDEWRHRWTSWRDEDARQKAEQLLARIYVLIRRLSRNNHRRELIAFLERVHIPGWRRAFAPTHTRSR